MSTSKGIRFVLLLLLMAPSIFRIADAQVVYQQKFDCFSILVGKDASADGSVLFGHNEDTGTRLVNFFKVPGRESKGSDSIYFETGGKIVRSWDQIPFLWLNRPEVDVCDSYLNEKGVAVGSDGCPSREDEPDLTDGGIVYWLRRIVAERAQTSREGVKIAGQLIDTYGYASSGRTYIIADASEGWLLAVVHGKRWVAQRVPDNQVAVVANCYSIGEIDLADTLNFLGSPDIIDYAVSRGWYDPDKDGKFHFAKAYSNPGSLSHPANVNRMWMAISLLSGKKYPVDSDFPSMTVPLKPISLQDVMSVLKVHFNKSAVDDSPYRSMGSPSELLDATLSGKETQYSFVAHLRNNLPEEIRSVLWLTPFRPDVHAYSPWYPHAENVPAVFSLTDHQTALDQHFELPADALNRNNGHAFWDYVALADLVDENYGKLAPLVTTRWLKAENASFINHGNFERRMSELYLKSPGAVRGKLEDYGSKAVLKNYRMVKKIIKKLD
jgi:dipeptidase